MKHELASSTALSNQRLLVEYLKPHAIRCNPKNPRRHGKKDVRDLAASVRALGANIPIGVDANGVIVSGELWYHAYLELQLPLIPVIRLHHLSQAEADLFTIAVNKFTDRTKFDIRALGKLFKELSALNLDISLEVSGFEMAEIDMTIEGLEIASVEDEAPEELPGAAAISQVGGLWVLVSPDSKLEHRLLVGDARDPESFAILIGDAKAAAAITDPPFGGKISTYMRGSSNAPTREFVMGSEGRTPEELEHLLDPVCVLIRNACQPGALVYIFMDWRNIETLLRVGGRVFDELKNLIVWAKTAAGMGSYYRSQHELIALFKVPGGKHRNNIQLGKFGRNRSNLWQFAGMNTPAGRLTDEGDLRKLHVTPKPVEMIAEAILDCTERGDIVLDPFLGSGTTLIAAERTGRRAFTMDLDPLYADVAIRRWRRLTGGDAVRAADGRSFSSLEAEASQ